MQLIRIKELRQENYYTQKELADLLNTTQSQISKYETDSSSLSIEALIAYSKIFNVSTDYILGLTNIKNYTSSNQNLLEDCISLFNQIDTLDQRIIIGEMAALVKSPNKQKKKI